MNSATLNSISRFLVKSYQENAPHQISGGMSVNPIVSELASWYERLRNAMEYRDDEVILRAAIERILKRRLIMGGNGKSAAPLIRELIWARYFPDGTISEETIDKVEQAIDFYLKLREQVITQHKIAESKLTEWIYHLMSSHIEDVLSPSRDKETMINFMFHILKENISIIDDDEQTRDAQVFIAIRRSYGKNDLALLRYHLFIQFFEKIDKDSIEKISLDFKNAYIEIEKQLSYSARHKIFSYIKKQTPPFLILDDVFISHRENLQEILNNEEQLNKLVYDICQKRYNNITSKVRRAIIRSVIFILLSKALFAFAIEGTYETYLYGKVLWGSMILNIAIPPLLMVFVGFSIQTPDKKNTERILQRIKILLFDRNPKLGYPTRLRHKRQKTRSLLQTIFSLLWFAGFILSFGLVILILSKLQFNIISQGVFIFFLAIVSFLAYRIHRTAHIYTVGDKQGLLTPLIDFFFMPIAQVGRYLTEGISQLNIFLFILDFIIETPFKGMFAFFEQWFLFLHAKRDNLD